MEIAVLDYQTGTINTIKNCPDKWETEDIEKYLYEALGYKQSDIYYMCGDSIPHTEEEYIPESKRRLYKKWREAKDEHPYVFLLFRSGDFYVCYDEDAVKASKILGITQTSYSTHVDGKGKPLKTALFPQYALDTYLPKLIRAGERVAICDELKY